MVLVIVPCPKPDLLLDLLRPEIDPEPAPELPDSLVEPLLIRVIYVADRLDMNLVRDNTLLR